MSSKENQNSFYVSCSLQGGILGGLIQQSRTTQVGNGVMIEFVRTSGLLSKGIHLPPKGFSASAGLSRCSDIAQKVEVAE